MVVCMCGLESFLGVFLLLTRHEWRCWTKPAMSTSQTVSQSSGPTQETECWVQLLSANIWEKYLDWWYLSANWGFLVRALFGALSFAQHHFHCIWLSFSVRDWKARFIIAIGNSDGKSNDSQAPSRYQQQFGMYLPTYLLFMLPPYK